MTKEEKDFEKVQGEAIELIKNKKGNKKMKLFNKNNDAPKVEKTYTGKQIARTIGLIIATAIVTALATLYINGLVSNYIKSEVTSQVKSFTAAE